MLKNNPYHNLLLDTHVWIWLNNGSPELAQKIIHQIDTVAQNGQIFIPAISIWEIAVLVEKKRIILRTSIHEWIETALAEPSINLLPLSPDIAIESTQLPYYSHNDPADRMIIASARIKKLTILTRDEKILTYAQLGYVRATAV